MEISVVEESKICLLGLITRGMLERSFRHSLKRKLASRMRGDVLIQAGRMTVYLFMDGEHWIISPTPRGDVSAGIKGSLTALTAVTAGRIPLLSALRLELLPSGNPFILLKLFYLMRG